MSDEWKNLEMDALVLCPVTGGSRISGARECARIFPENEAIIRAQLRSTLDEELARAAAKKRRINVADMLKPGQWGPIVMDLHLADLSLGIRLFLVFSRFSADNLDRGMWLECINPVDYSIRPAPPNLLEGGLPMTLHTRHEKLGDHLQTIPGHDGERFEPPRTFSLLKIGNSYLIAESFYLVSGGV